MRLSHLADYAVVLMTAAARRPAGARLSATELAGETGVPLPTAQKLMGQLAGSGLLTSVRGAGGGFALARGASEISLADIIEAIEGPIAMTQCSGSDEASDCALDAHCRVKGHMGVVSGAVRGALGAVSLQHLCSPAKAGAQERASASASLAHPAHPEEGLSAAEGPSRRFLRDAISTSSMAPQDERKGVAS